MSSQWFCFTDDEDGPYSFEELATLIARGELLQTDLVRRQEATEWQRVETVFGLLRAASRIRSQAVRRTPAPQTGVLSQIFSRFCRRYFPNLQPERLLMAVSLLCITICLGELAWYWWQRPVRFPTPPVLGVTVESPAPSQIRSPSPMIPSISSLRPGEPELVPGFESLGWLKSPSLSADLLTIIYIGYAGPDRLDEVMIADRQSVLEPFQNRRPIRAVSSPLREAHPTLSPDGLSLAFVRLEEAATLWISQRTDRQSNFRKASRLRLLQDSVPDHHHDAPQFLDSKTLRITISDREFTDRQQWLAIRESADTFRLKSPVAMGHPWPRACLMPNGKRSFLITEEGLKVSWYSPRTHRFEAPELLFGTDVIGSELTTNDDTFWVAPKEDVIFFCGPGLQPTSPDSRKLWMIRL